MATPRSRAKQTDRSGILASVNNPLAFFVLNLLIIEAMLTVVLTCSKLDEVHIWAGFLWMVGIFIGEVLIVTGLTILSPTKLLYGKEEHREHLLEPSALRDQIEDMITGSVKSEALKSPSL